MEGGLFHVLNTAHGAVLMLAFTARYVALRAYRLQRIRFHPGGTGYPCGRSPPEHAVDPVGEGKGPA